MSLEFEQIQEANPRGTVLYTDTIGKNENVEIRYAVRAEQTGEGKTYHLQFDGRLYQRALQPYYYDITATEPAEINAVELLLAAVPVAYRRIPLMTFENVFEAVRNTLKSSQPDNPEELLTWFRYYLEYGTPETIWDKYGGDLLDFASLLNPEAGH